MSNGHKKFNDIGLTCLGDRLKEDLDCLLYPSKSWVPPRDGVTDIVIIGGGMCGMVAWLALSSGGIKNIRILDRAPKGKEGPWLTYARMETLRSPKNLTGPSFGHGPLTFQAWYRAQYGEDAWEKLDKIPRSMWMDYLMWYRKILEIPIENGISVDQLEPEENLLRLSFSGAENGTLICRKVIFATGRDGTGGPNLPGFVDNLPRKFWAHSSDKIDFAALRNKRVAVVGVGASAVDNSAEALEHGAAEVRHLIRRNEMPTINKMMGIGSYGLTAAYAALPDEWRWRFMQYSFATQTPPPHGSTLRVSRHENAYFHFGKETIRIEQQGNSIEIFFADGTSHSTDYLILATGFTIDPMARTEFGEIAGDIMLWQDMYLPPIGEESEDLGRFPYLNSDFTFQEKKLGVAPWLRNVYCFNYGAAVSLGKVSGDIPGISEGAAWLGREVAAKLYAEDVELHWQGMLNYAKPELNGTEWTPTELKQKTRWGRVA